MKISVYSLQKITPKGEDEKENMCDILNLPTLKSGYIEIVGEFSHFITLSELRKLRGISQRYYSDETLENILDGTAIVINGKKMFAHNH